MKRLYNLNDLKIDEILKTLEYKETYINKHLWKYYYFITKILNKYSRRLNNDEGYCRVSSEELKNKLGKIQINGKREWAYLTIRKQLSKDLMILKFRSQFDPVTEKRYSLYKIKEEYLSRGWSQVKNIELSDSLLEKMERTQEYGNPYSSIERVLNNITIQYDEAITFTKEALITELPLKPKRKKYKKGIFRKMDQETYSHWMMDINNINDGYYFFDVALESSGRVTNTFTSVPRELRKFLRLNGKPLVEVDVRNCQPLLFIVLLVKWAKEKGMKISEDVKKYKELCEAGKFYDYLVDLMISNGEDINEDMFKVDFFARVFFSKEKKKYKWRAIFEKEFEQVSKCISDLKKDGHQKLAISLQKLESDIMILDVCNKLYNDGNFEVIPLHDAIYCTSEQVSKVKETLIKAFDNLGLKVRFKK